MSYRMPNTNPPSEEREKSAPASASAPGEQRAVREEEWLAVIAGAALDYLNANYEESEIELDGEKAELYNLAAAVAERNQQDGESHIAQMMAQFREDADGGWIPNALKAVTDARRVPGPEPLAVEADKQKSPTELLALAAKGMSQEEREELVERGARAQFERDYEGDRDWPPSDFGGGDDEAQGYRNDTRAVLATLLPEEPE